MIIKKYRFRGDEIQYILLDEEKQLFNYSGWNDPNFWERYGENSHPVMRGFPDTFPFDTEEECVDAFIEQLSKEWNEIGILLGDLRARKFEINNNDRYRHND